jgi:hypothetical protein
MAELGILMKAHDEASGVMKNIGMIAVGLGAALVAGAALAVKAAAEEQVGMAQLEKAIRNTGVAWQGSITAAEKQVTAWQNMSAVADDEIRPAFALLIAQTGSLAEATRRMPLALDLARGANIDLASASKLLGKLTEENVNVFKKLGLTFKEGATELDVMAAVQEKFGGQSATFAATAVGQWEILQHTIGDFVEDVGSKLLPMVTTGIGIIGELFGVITGSAPEAGGKLRAAIGGPMAEAIMGALAAVRDTAQLIFAGDFPALIQRVVSFVGEALPRLRDQLLKWAGEFIAWVGPQIPKLLGELTKLLGQGLDWLNAHSEEIGQALVAWGIKFGEFIRDVALPALQENLPSIQQALIDFALTVPGKINSFFVGVGKGIVDAIGGAVRDSWNDIADAFRYMLTQAIQAIDFWVGPFHVSGTSGITVSMPSLTFPSVQLPSFADGGIVPGPIGAPQLVIAHGGEPIGRNAGAGAGTGGGGGDIHIHFDGPVYGMPDFEDTVARVVRDRARSGGFRGAFA